MAYFVFSTTYFCTIQLNSSLAEYHVPVHLDIPPIEIITNDFPVPHSPLGAHKIGIIGVTAAIANAVFKATEKRVWELSATKRF